MFIDVGEWDLRKATLTGESKRLGRYIDHIYEEINIKVRSMRLEEGKNVTQYYLIFDMDGFSLGKLHNQPTIDTNCPFNPLFNLI